MEHEDQELDDGSIDTILHRSGFFSMQRRAQRRRDPADSIPVLLSEAALLDLMDKQVIKSIEAGDLGAGVWIVPSSQWVSPVGEVLTGWKDEQGWVLERAEKLSNDDVTVAGNFLAEGRSVMLVTTHERVIPPLIRTTAAHVFRVPALSNAVIGKVIKSVANGRIPAKLSGLELGVLDFSEVAALLGQGGNAADIVDRLAAAVERKSAPAQPSSLHLPDLSVATEYGAARLWAMDLKADLEAVRRGELGWEDVDRGCLLSSEPGCGKSLFSLALGAYLGVPVVQTSMGALFASGPGYLDSVVKALRGVFEKARSQAPAVLFVDEIDSIPSPDTSDGKHDAWWRTVATEFLLLLDSAVSDRGGVIVVGATNRPHAVHPSVTRPGRIERVLHIGPPDAEGAERVMRHHLGKDLADVDISDIAQIASNERMTPAELMEGVRAARRIARNARRPMAHHDLMSRFRPPDERSEEDLRIVAVHEAGHALLGALLAPDDIVSSSIERGKNGSGGRLSILIDRKMVSNRNDFTNRARIFLGGRAAEQIVLGSSTLGSGGSASSDIALATAELAELHLALGSGRQLRWRCPPEEALAKLHQHPAVRVEVETELGELYEEVLSLIQHRRPTLDRLADSLLQQRTIDADRIREIVLDSSEEASSAAHASAATKH